MNKTEKTENENASYLTFRLGEEEFAVHVDNVLNIMELPNITKIPDSPNYMRGVINLRGKVLPVIDTSMKLNMKPIEYTYNTCIVVMENNHTGEKFFFGSLVDKVESVYEIDESEMKAPSDHGNIYDPYYITGLLERQGDFILVLDVEKMFNQKDMQSLKANAEF